MKQRMTNQRTVNRMTMKRMTVNAMPTVLAVACSLLLLPKAHSQSLPDSALTLADGTQIASHCREQNPALPAEEIERRVAACQMKELMRRLALELNSKSEMASATAADRVESELVPLSDPATGNADPPGTTEEEVVAATGVPAEDAAEESPVPHGAIDDSAAAEGDRSAREAAARADVERAVAAWGRSWAAQDISGYLNAYHPEFQPRSGTREAWRTLRERRLQTPSFIEVEIGPVAVERDGDLLRSSFRQTYRSDRFSDVVHKTLWWKAMPADDATPERWLIVKERATPLEGSDDGS